MLVNIDVPDAEAAVRFYTDALLLRVGQRFNPDFIELVGAAVPIYVLGKDGTTTPFAGASAARDYARHWTPVHLDFVVDDLEAAVLRAESAGAVREGELSEHVWGRMATFADPFGHGFCLIELKGRGYAELLRG